MIDPNEIEILAERLDNERDQLDRDLSPEGIKTIISNVKHELETQDLPVAELTTVVNNAVAKLEFAAKYATEEQVKKNFTTLQEIIDDAPEFQVVETAQGTKTIRIAGTENRDRIAAINTFLKYNLKTPDGDVPAPKHLHIHAAQSAIEKILKGDLD